jgi:hypothetical protein
MARLKRPATDLTGGNFGYLDSPWFGNPALGTTQNCTTQQKTVITNDIAVGLDHVVVPIGATARRDDTCPYTLEAPPDHMFTQTGGTPNAYLDPPMVSGSAFSDGRPARLQRVPAGSWPTRTVGGNRLDDQPLWSFIDPNLTAPTIPASCQRASFNGAGATKAHMVQCLTNYRTSVLAFPGTPALFTVASKPPRCTGASYDIQCSARFAFVPQSKQDLTGCTGSCDFDVLGFLPVFVQSAFFDCNGGSCDRFDPGLSFSGKGKTLDAISGFVFDSVTQQALPRAVVSPGPGGPLTGLPPALVEIGVGLHRPSRESEKWRRGSARLSSLSRCRPAVPPPVNLARSARTACRPGRSTCIAQTLRTCIQARHCSGSGLAICAWHARQDRLQRSVSTCDSGTDRGQPEARDGPRLPA